MLLCSFCFVDSLQTLNGSPSAFILTLLPGLYLIGVGIVGTFVLSMLETLYVDLLRGVLLIVFALMADNENKTNAVQKR